MGLVARVRAHLRLKVLGLIVGILILGFGSLVILNIQRETQALVEGSYRTARLLSASIAASIETAMLEVRPDLIRQLVQELRRELGDVRRIDIYRRNGVEAFTDLETVKAVDQLAGLPPSLIDRITKLRREPGPRLADPLFAQAVESRAPRELEERLGESRVLTLYRPLANAKACHECHGAEHPVRGVVRISLGLETLDAEVRKARNRQVTVAFLTIFGVAATLVVFLGRVVIGPVARVAAVARRIGDGEFEARVAIRSPDEIGQLGQAIDDMAGHLKATQGDLAARNAELATALANLQESMQKVALLEQLKGELTKFVPEAVTRLLEKNPDARELEKREADVSVLFLDVEGYTRLSEQLPPQRLNRMIQDYFSSFLEIIRAHHGDVNETAGDGLMVIFQSEEGRERHALNAAGAAFLLLGKVAALNQEFTGIYPPVAIHVGINSGPALVGATKLDAAGGGRWTFTASGPTTNLAARIAGLTRGGEVKVGPETAERIRNRYVLEDTGEHTLKNVSQPVRVFRLVPAGVYQQVVQ